jgi:hypothetical protein
MLEVEHDIEPVRDDAAQGGAVGTKNREFALLEGAADGFRFALTSP